MSCQKHFDVVVELRKKDSKKVDIVITSKMGTLQGLQHIKMPES